MKVCSVYNRGSGTLEMALPLDDEYTMREILEVVMPDLFPKPMSWQDKLESVTKNKVVVFSGTIPVLPKRRKTKIKQDFSVVWDNYTKLTRPKNKKFCVLYKRVRGSWAEGLCTSACCIPSVTYFQVHDYYWGVLLNACIDRKLHRHVIYRNHCCLFMTPNGKQRFGIFSKDYIQSVQTHNIPLLFSDL